jgi:hypothetical protein
MMTTSILPDGFAPLEAFVDRWALTTSLERSRRRETSSLAEMRDFYEACAPRLKDALAYLDSKRLADFDPMDERLMALCLSLAHVALAVEIQGEAEPENAACRHEMRITRTTAERMA